MNPVEHGEVFVTVDGDETDQDIGNYERFLNQDITKQNYMTTGRAPPRDPKGVTGYDGSA